ncbi:hypothetical protein NA56DRAFT_672340 [Hyaloscypha hepaticicola]|uniref:Protein kinase domain-containing protein n=1 Tax=Hyaloscypha hepaticicola TaxID=2082293 RepID=A0A2J6PWV1_9HELO|nr:hypothetical protein NA56DRAFT_672340 [Hyaloscypha hepaticicola]
MPYKLLDISGSSIVSIASDGKTAFKGEENGYEKLLAQEDYVYRLLDEYANILEYYGLIEIHPATPSSQDNRLRMALGISSGIAHYIKVRDFGSATVNGDPSRANIVKEIRYKLPLRGRVFEHRPSIKRKLFALGSTIYEIMTWEMPFEDLETNDIEKKYTVEEFPDITRLLAEDIIRDY